MSKKKILVSCLTFGISAGALGAMSVSAQAADTIDFEDGNCSFVSMKTDDGGDNSDISVVDFNGSKQLKIDVKDCSLIPKVSFDINAILDDDQLSKVKKISMDLTIESKDGTTAPGWAGGAIGTQGGAEEDAPSWGQTSWEGGEYDNAVSEPITVERKFLLPTEKYVDGTEYTSMIVMRWACEVNYNMYIDNITFYDKNGNIIAPTFSESAVATEAIEEITEEETVPADITEEESTEDTVETSDSEEANEEVKPAEPSSDEKTTSVTTGNASAVAAASALVLAAYGVFMTCKKKK